jgi:Tol biopolymer transport system component
MDAAGKLAPLISKPAVYGRPSVSPQGDRIAVEVYDSSGSDIYVYDPRRNNMSHLTFGGSNVAPVWTPDDRYIVFQDAGGMGWIRSDGGGAPQSLTKSKNLQFPWSFSPDGKRLGFLEAGKTGYDLLFLPLDIDSNGIRPGKPDPFLNSDAGERSPTFSPDGRWIAYSSNESGTFEVYVRAFPDKGGKWQISSGGANYPFWSRTGHELIYETVDARIMSASYSVENSSFKAETPRPWSPRPIVNLVNSVKNFDLAPDGKRIAALLPTETEGDANLQSHVIFLLNFFDELERRVPSKK